MRRKRLMLAYVLGLILALAGSALTSSCGTVRTHWGMEHEYQYDFPDGSGHHHKHKKPKHKKHKHHKHHHHHDD
ncbi:MAG: hypothetical protein K2H17_02320 [Duncaniella sp.]|uniref:hypothetical protein n=1 Tax=Duncaniella sp. TaxID=2518496 RepID=UPI0023C37887|nr:hypothetical protein [Duncaniella sp.]MDE5988211.1 hypothetical protein [Duncaniella sp.]